MKHIGSGYTGNEIFHVLLPEIENITYIYVMYDNPTYKTYQIFEYKNGGITFVGYRDDGNIIKPKYEYLETGIEMTNTKSFISFIIELINHTILNSI
jgi:hypothetical protein